MNETASERAAMWDARYEPAPYAYGEAANAFLVAQAPRLERGMRALVPGDGEGRNGVWLAEQGLVVDTLDLSAQGVAKARRLAAVRAAADPSTELRLDANGAWSVQEAVRSIDALAPAGLELVEEPTHGLREVRAVREQVAVRIAIDETAAEPGALAAGVADAVCLKISRCGGIGGLVAAAALVRSTGAEVYVASTLDGPLGIAAGLHAAAALASRGPVPHCGLATLDLFTGIPNPLPVLAGAIAVPTGPGLGVGGF